MADATNPPPFDAGAAVSTPKAAAERPSPSLSTQGRAAQLERDTGTYTEGYNAGVAENVNEARRLARRLEQAEEDVRRVRYLALFVLGLLLGLVLGLPANGPRAVSS